MEAIVSPFKTASTNARTPQTPEQIKADNQLRHAARHAEQTRRQAQECAKLVSLPVQHDHAAGIDVGDQSHWICVEATPDGSDTVREFPAHTPGLRQLLDWLRQCGVTTVALEATGAYAHVLFLTLVEADFTVVMTPPQFARQIKGRLKTDKRDCQWIQRLHKHGLLPAIFQPDDATQTLRDYVRDEIHTLTLVSELGTDFTKWPTVGQFCSWLGLCPNWQQTGGKVKSSAVRRGQNRAARALRLASWALLRSKSYLGAYLRRQRSRLGAPKAITACAHKLARIVYNLVRYGMSYVKQTEAVYAEQVRERLERQLQRRALELGFEVRKIEAVPSPAVT
jgi:transposase